MSSSAYLFWNTVASACLLYSTCVHSSSAYDACNRSKWRWVALSVLGFLGIGLPVLVWYVIRVRPGLHRADAAHLQERRAARAAAAKRASTQATARSATSGAALPSFSTKQKCNCVNGMIPHYACQGRGSFKRADGGYDACGCMQGQEKCPHCGGSGYRSF